MSLPDALDETAGRRLREEILPGARETGQWRGEMTARPRRGPSEVILDSVRILRDADGSPTCFAIRLRGT